MFYLEKLLKLQRFFPSFFLTLRLKEDKLELERKVILNEIAEDHDDPQELIRETLIKCLFKHHPLRNPILG